ncbi:MAG: class I SAM-dependent methyltransferase [Chitinophagaceae bacterium]
MNNINDTFFDGHYKEIWKAMIPDELTRREIDFMIPYFGLQPESRVLDLMCGYGRHTLALSRKGVQVTAVDNLGAYIDEIREAATNENLPVTLVCGSVLDFYPEGQYDLTICMGNSLNFFDPPSVGKLFSMISSSLKQGGSLLVNSWSLAEIIYKNFRERGWSRIGELKFLTESAILFQPTRMETESRIQSPDGKEEIKKGIDYIYSLNEMESMLAGAGLRLREVFSIPGKKPFAVGEPRAYLVAEKS